jgi:hypothetical protein
VKQITVTIKNGKVEMEVGGVKGGRCVELTEAVERMLGRVDSRVLKQDYYRPAEIRQKIDIEHRSPSLAEGKD